MEQNDLRKTVDVQVIYLWDIRFYRPISTLSKFSLHINSARDAFGTERILFFRFRFRLVFTVMQFTLRVSAAICLSSFTG
jgi:hypothetical protein